jgi:uncharacterized protein (UPF0276 family)
MANEIKLGVGYRPELALVIDRREDLAFVEILAEDYRSPRDIPEAIKSLRRRGVEVLVHSTVLSLGQAPRSGLSRVGDGVAEEKARLQTLQRQLKHLNQLAGYLDSPFVSDHIAFVRAGALESGHLLPVERNEAMLAVFRRNISLAKEILSVPLVLENIACTFDQPGAEMDEATFVRRVLEENDCGLLLDLSNLFANAHNLKFSSSQYLQSLPLERLQYVHLAGGTFKRGLYHDTHCHPLKQQSLSLLAQLARMTKIPRVMLERDDSFPEPAEFNGELDAIRETVAQVVEQGQAPLSMISLPESMQSSSVSMPAAKGSLNFSRLPLNTPTLPEEAGSRYVSALVQVMQNCAVAARQEKLTCALLGLGAAPDGYDRARIGEAAEALKRKRLRAIKRAHPCLGAADAQIDAALALYFTAFPSVPEAGPYADGQAFFQWQKTKKTGSCAASLPV